MLRKILGQYIVFITLKKLMFPKFLSFLAGVGQYIVFITLKKLMFPKFLTS